MRPVEEIQSEHHYFEVTNDIQNEYTIVMCFVDPKAPQCWDATKAINQAANDPVYDQTVGFFFFDTSLDELRAVMDRIRVCHVPVFVFFRAGAEPLKVFSGGSSEDALSIIERHCK